MIPHMCRVCRTVLDQFRPLDGSAPEWRHTHANSPVDGHAPIAVPTEEMTDVRGRCDFCSAWHPVWVYVVMDRPTLLATEDGQIAAGSEDADGLWSACQECADLIDVRRIGGLVKRALSSLPFADTETRVTIHQLYKGLFDSPTMKQPIGREFHHGQDGRV